MILGAALLEGGGEEVAVMSPPQPDKVTAKIDDRHTQRKLENA